MQLSTQRLILVLLAALVAGCSSAPEKQDPLTTGEPQGTGAVGAADTIAMPFQAPVQPAKGLTPDMVFNVLAGEVAMQRGEMTRAYGHQMAVAALAGDAKAAERAARIALHIKETVWAVNAVNKWVQLTPNDLAARQLAVVLYLKANRREAAFEQLKAIVEISESKKENGFLHAMATASRDLKPDVAIGLMRRLAEAYTDDPRGWHALSLTALNHKLYAVAENETMVLLKRHPQWLKSYLVLSRVYVAQGRKAEARELLAGAVDKNPDEPMLVAAYAWMLVDSKQMQQAYDCFLKLQTLDPEDESASYRLGILALELDRKEAAEKHFKQLYTLRKRADIAAYYLGRLREGGSQPKQAIEWYRKVNKGKYRYKAQVRTARLMAGQGQLQEARERLQGLRIRTPKQSVQLFLLEATLLRDYGNPGQVMSLYDKALEGHPENVELLYARGLFAVSQNRLDIMERDLGKIIASNPKHAGALNAFGYTLADQAERVQEALGLIQRALEIKHDEPAFLDSMGWVQYRLGNHQEALRYLRQAFETLPDSEIAAHYGEVLWVTGDHEQAGKVWQGVLDQDPESKHILEVMQRLAP
ncbi:tetratricopeptide repeat protein [Candidatus Vondammii sp. HM_W22]|uniref:tetratricopeptide repeat protein n=1 Tax=Candidatus Vondammii sp. HM_W22 TaxID=2687299 RepID=UPI002E7AD538|nr:tetratricopeptide repeat protein [Candidatus Vondammii sp. HM_W22]